MNHAQAAKDAIEGFMKPVLAELDTYDVREMDPEQIIEYAVTLHIKNRKWKAQRLARKTAEHFKLRKR
jgi:hypothetical protein